MLNPQAFLRGQSFLLGPCLTHFTRQTIPLNPKYWQEHIEQTHSLKNILYEQLLSLHKYSMKTRPVMVFV